MAVLKISLSCHMLCAIHMRFGPVDKCGKELLEKGGRQVGQPHASYSPVSMTDIKEEPVNTQPMGTAPMSTGGSKNALNSPIGPDGKRKWSYGLFDCFSACGLCCFATWCPCIVYSRNRQHFRSLQTQGTVLPAGSEQMDDQCCIYCGLVVLGYGWVLQIRNREEIRERYGIRGSGLSDCLASWCCHSCALTQERREIELEERNFQ